MSAPTQPAVDEPQQTPAVTHCLLLIAKAFGLHATDPGDQPIVDPEEVRRHDEQFERDNPDWDKQYGGKR